MSWTLLSAVTLPCKFLHAGVLNLLRPQLKCVLNESNPPVHSPPSLPVWLLLTLLSTVFCLFPLQKHVLVGVHGLSVGADSICGPHLLCWSSVWKQQHPPPELHPGLLWDGISARWHLFFFSPAPVFLLKCVCDQLLPSFLYLQTGVWHVPQIWTSFNCDAASWCFLSSSVFHWPRQRGSSGLHHVQVRTPCCFCCLKINVYLSWWILLQHYDMNIIIGFITWFKKHRTSSNWSDLFLTV